MRTFAISALLAAGLAFSGFVFAQDNGQAQPAQPTATGQATAPEAAKPATEHKAAMHKHHAKHHHAAKKGTEKAAEPAKADGAQQ
ncbi:MAG: hypothetical protein ABFC67_05485 [Mizugakiibacter sp.]|uniref:hypothetical protein n=1 Tax=Mizugakiibacter sp. TaxID=1972610 RepID=UPI0031C7B354|nr:hypothetical protein [Xanthomonadaceae bacterium]